MRQNFHSCKSKRNENLVDLSLVLAVLALGMVLSGWSTGQAIYRRYSASKNIQDSCQKNLKKTSSDSLKSDCFLYHYKHNQK